MGSFGKGMMHGFIVGIIGVFGYVALAQQNKNDEAKKCIASQGTPDTRGLRMVACYK